MDTTPAAASIQLQAFRDMGPERRLEAALAWSDAMISVMREGIRQRHPAYTEDEISMAQLRLVMGEEQFFAAFPGSRVQP